MRKFRFGVMCNGTTQLPAGAGSHSRRWQDFARKVEELGYSSLTIPDHFTDQLGPVPALAAAAMVTEKIKLGALVWCNDYKHPVVLAKELATLDVLSEGRLQLGLGAGWMKQDYHPAGLQYDTPGVRIDRMVEGLQVIRGLFGAGPFSHSGKYYQLDALEGTPKPLQASPPVLIGGGGKKMLTVAAQRAEIVGINVKLSEGEMGASAASNTTADATLEKVKWVREAAGARYSQIEMNVMVFGCAVTDNPAAACEGIAKHFGVPPETLKDSPHVLAGSLDSIVEQIEKRRELYDLSYVVVSAEQMAEFAPVVARLHGK